MLNWHPYPLSCLMHQLTLFVDNMPFSKYFMSCSFWIVAQWMYFLNCSAVNALFDRAHRSRCAWLQNIKIFFSYFRVKHGWIILASVVQFVVSNRYPNKMAPKKIPTMLRGTCPRCHTDRVFSPVKHANEDCEPCHTLRSKDGKNGCHKARCKFAYRSNFNELLILMLKRLFLCFVTIGLINVVHREDYDKKVCESAAQVAEVNWFQFYFLLSISVLLLKRH